MKRSVLNFIEYSGEVLLKVVNLDADYERDILRKKIHIHMSFRIKSS